MAVMNDPAMPSHAQGSALPSSASAAGPWRSATDHDVHADNRDEDIFGWIQPDEWDTVAGPNKSNFMRGDCLECTTDKDTANVPSLPQSCGGASCGYGAQCCEYSRRATHTHGPSDRTPALLLQRPRATSTTNKIADLAKIEHKNSLGVSLVDIIHGRSCRPISLLDLRTFLHFQRQPQKRLPAYYPASDMQSSALDDFDLNLDQPSASPTHLFKHKLNARRLHFDEVDALDFLVAYERYVTKFRDQPRAHRLQSPDPATCKAALRAYVRRQCKPRVSSDLTVAQMLMQEAPTPDDDVDDISEQASREVLARLRPTDLGLKPDQQPLRVEFDRLVHRYLCSRRVCILPSNRRLRRKRDSSSSSDTAAGGSESPYKQLGSSSAERMPRLRWMVDVGLISESDLQLCLAECDFSTHPDVLAPIAEAVYAYMSQHVVPFFFISVARNLSPNTKRGRLLVGVACTTIALIFSILLIISPSPLAPHANHGTGNIPRWWRLLTAPVWCAGLGYILAYFTGLCVWLTLRGNREPDEEEEREREEIRSRISGEDVVGFDLAELQATADERDMEVEQDTNRWMAPEIADILTGFTGQKKDKRKRQRSSSDALRLDALEEGHLRVKSEATDVVPSSKVSFEYSLTAEKPSDASEGAMTSFADKASALAAPAAVIMNTPRRPSMMPVMSETNLAGRPSTTLSARDVSAANSVRPSLERSGHSQSDVRPADARGAVNGDSPSGPALLRQKRVPLLNLSIGFVKAPGHERGEDQADAPVLTRDALLFDPELAARVTTPTVAGGPMEGSPVRGAKSIGAAGGSQHGSPPARRKSLAHVLLPLRSGARLQAQMEDAQLSSPTYETHSEKSAEHAEIAMPTVPEPTALASMPVIGASATSPRDIAPWAIAPGRSVDLPSSARPVLFALPSSRKSRMSATTSTTVVASPLAPVSAGAKRSYEESPSLSLRERLWIAVQRGTGFAVGTERVLDARVRRAQQMKALRIMALNTLATVVVMVIVVAVP